MKLSQFTLYKNTNFTDMQNTLHFNSNLERDNWFSSYFTDNNVITFSHPFNFRYDRGTLKVPIDMNELQGFNYCKFVDGFDGKTYYAFIVKTSYLNDKTTQLDLVIDVVMTFTQGNILENLQNVEVIRQHLPLQQLKAREEFLRMNNDVLPTSTMMFVDPSPFTSDNSKGVQFNDFMYIIQSAVELNGEFGTEDHPTMNTSIGGTFDGITSAISLYLVSSDDLDRLLTALSRYPWITQNFKTIVKVPKMFFDLSELNTKDCEGVRLYVLDGANSSNVLTLPFVLKKSKIKEVLGLKDFEDYLVRDNVINIYLTDYRGNQLNFETGKIKDDNTIYANCVLGAFNEIDIYSAEYGQRDTSRSKRGFYRDNQMTINTFDNVPVMVDNYTLNKANTAYSRQLENSRTISGRYSAITNPNNSVNDRLFNAISVYSNVFDGGLLSAPAKAAGLFSNEYEYYRNQKAQMNQWKISPPTVSEGGYTNSVLNKTGDYGIWLKVSTISYDELNSLRRYYGAFGHEAMANDNRIYNVNSMSKANWVQFKGNYWIDDIDRELFDQLKTLFEGGVRLWHNYSELAARTEMSDNNVIGFVRSKDLTQLTEERKNKMPSYKTYTTEQYTKFLKNSTSNNFGFSDDKLADWFMGQAGAVPVISSYGVTKENLLSTYIPKIKEYQGEAAFFLFYTVTEGGGAGNWINHYQNDTSSTGLGCLIDDLEYCKSIDNNYPGYPVAMTAQEVAGIPPQENINQAQQVYRECGKGTIGSIMMPSTMAGNAWVFAENWCLENQGSRPPAVYFGNPYDHMIKTIKDSGADPFGGGGSGGGGGGSIDEGLPGNNAPTQTTPTVDTSELMTAFESLMKVVKEQIEKLKDVSDSNVYPLSLNKMYQANKYYKLTKMMNLTRVTLSREILDDIIKTIQDAVSNAENSAENLQASNKNENVNTNPPEPPAGGGGSGETSELDNYINKAIAHMKDLQDRGFTYSMDARWGATSRDCSSAVCESYNLGNGNTVTMDSTQLPNHGFEKVVENPYMADGWSAQRGDVFILYPNGSTPAASGGAAGHTGIFIDNVNIIHMNYASNGVSIDHCANVFSSYYGLNVWRPTRAN